MRLATKSIRTMFLLAIVFLSNAYSQSFVPDPTAPGPFGVSSAIYDFGDTALNFNGFPGPIEFRGSVHYPANLPGGPFPLIVLLHGRHFVCFQGNSFLQFQWPCAAGSSPIPSFQGYDYLAQNLASHGYIVISISANGINAADSVSDAGALARAQLIQTHLDLWNQFNTAGAAPFGTLFVGKVDMQRIGTMGHSRGGEGVVRHFILNQSLGSPYGIKAVFALAPIDFNDEVINNVPLGVILPYCDGDVVTLEGIHYYDESRYNVPGDTGAKHAILVMGADHNFFNTVWTPALFQPAGDDWAGNVRNSDPFCGTVSGNQRLSPAEQQASGLTYIGAFLRAYVGTETSLLPLLTGAALPSSVNPKKMHVSYHAPDNPRFRRDLNRFLDATGLTVGVPGSTVAHTGLTPYGVCGGAGEPSPCILGLTLGQQPHTDGFAPLPGLSQLITGWSAAGATYKYLLPAGKGNVSGFDALQFRAGVNFADGRNLPGVTPDFTVVLADGSGKTASTTVSKSAPGSLFFPPGSVAPVPKLILNSVRIPLSSFPGINLGDVRSVEFRFDRTPFGAINITDLAFASTPFN